MTADDEIMSPISKAVFTELFTGPKHTPDLSEGSFEARVWELVSREPRLIDTDPFYYWRTVAMVDPELAAVAAVALALPVTQVSVERAFSHLPLTITARRTRLKGETIDNLLVVKLNLENE